MAHNRCSLVLAACTVTLSGIATLGMVELGFRIFAPQPTKISIPAIIDDELIYRLPSSVRGTDVKEEFSVAIETNTLGLRDRDYPLRKPRGVSRRILVLGDSMTFAEGVEAHETYPHLLEEALGSRYEVINAAVRGYGTDQQVLLFEKLIPAYRPDIVLLAIYPFNDFDDNLFGHLFAFNDDQLVRVPLAEDSSPKYRYYRRQSNIQTFPGYRFAIEHSHLVNFVRSRWAAYEFRRTFPPVTVDEAREEKAWQLMQALLAAWVRRAAIEGITPAIILIPSPGQIRTGRENPTDARTRLVLDYARTHGLLVIDPREALRSAASRENLLYYPKDGHMTPAGHRIVAEQLSAGMFARGFLP